MTILLVPAPSIGSAIDGIAARLRGVGLDVVIGDAARLGSADLADIDIIAGPGTMPIDAALIARAPRLRAAVSVGVGCEGFDRQAAARGIRIATGTSRDNAGPLASATVMLMLALCHDLPGAERALAEGRRRVDPTCGLDERTVGLIGFGAIGREVARRLRAWDVAVRVSSPSLEPGWTEDGVEAVSLERLLRDSDVISLHAALTPATHHLLDRERLGWLRADALLVNTARGALIDEAALAEALAAGRLAGAALDCFEREPLDPASPLRGLPNVILTPHQIGHTRTGADAVVARFVDNILAAASNTDAG